MFKTCVRWDGHGEIVGYRGIGLFPPPLGVLDHPGLGMRQWPSRDPLALNDTRSPLRRAKLIELATADATWPHRPEDPGTCMVCDDIISIIIHLLAQQAPPAPADTTPPFTVATATPGPNGNGWNNQDLAITLAATDNTGGSGVKEIEHSISGASPAGTVVTLGSSVQENTTAEGTTTIAFFARDNAGNVEATKTLDVKIDKTPPQIAGVTDVQHNVNGWMRHDVLVSFPASDALSGLAFSSPDVPVSTEGAAQDIAGTAEDNAGNQATAIVTLNLDKTAPTTAGTPDRATDMNDWYNHLLTVAWNGTDALSGIASCSAASNYAGPDSASASVNG
ncbi:MAG: OmpL47-type beta-barrel domain-containing protein, partial [Candidatus Acidiferrales bacterium]